ncbi:energy transducer TonB [Pelagicoccus sp. SDUM812002]|uniref:energy transducer TonB family protein n=1 Tax=Pelagicoccus sp. SDUM812002 TaxID=3041266 RepID=UPI00280C7553|nr:energy transducer TonB [Pelagicoccus sp. SDUM812002]MDQ8188631.1 energy transducer TonB [Pelagicoccus sp. SDUM812002]
MKNKVLLILLMYVITGCTTTGSNTGRSEPPHILQKEDASYPENYAGDRKPQQIIVEMNLDETGRITDTFIHSSPDPKLNDVAIEAAKKFKFSPMINNGEKVPGKVRVPITIR